MAKKYKENPITPMQIHDKEFKRRGRNGYDSYEVDEFLDAIIDDYGDCLDQVVDLKNSNLELEKKLAQKEAEINQLKQVQTNQPVQTSFAEFDKDELNQLRDKILAILRKQMVDVDAQYQQAVADSFNALMQKRIDKTKDNAVKSSPEDGNGVQPGGIQITLPPRD